MTPDIRKIIDEAIASERDTGQLRKQLSERLAALSEKLVLPESDPITALMVFITGYIESVPSSLTLVTAVSKRLGFHSFAALFLHIA